MKALLTLTLLVIASQGIAQPVSPNYRDATGVMKTQSQRFIVARNSSAITLAEGMIVCPDLTDDDGMNVDTCPTAGNKPLCMVAKGETAAVGATFKCQTYGYTSVLDFVAGNGSATAGNVVYASTLGKVRVITSPTASNFPIGIALDASSATGDLEAFLQL